jgi:hypothetical protein
MHLLPNEYLNRKHFKNNFQYSKKTNKDLKKFIWFQNMKNSLVNSKIVFLTSLLQVVY